MKKKREVFFGFEKPVGADKFWFLEIFANKKRHQKAMTTESDDTKEDMLKLDDQTRYPNIADELIRVAKLQGPEEYKKLLESEFFKLATAGDVRYHPELAHEGSDIKKQS